ncbi:MAG: hypothetical protein ACFCD0_22390 [Gemmataceae bacterium]
MKSFLGVMLLVAFVGNTHADNPVVKHKAQKFDWKVKRSLTDAVDWRLTRLVQEPTVLPKLDQSCFRKREVVTTSLLFASDILDGLQWRNRKLSDYAVCRKDARLFLLESLRDYNIIGWVPLNNGYGGNIDDKVGMGLVLIPNRETKSPFLRLWDEKVIREIKPLERFEQLPAEDHVLKTNVKDARKWCAWIETLMGRSLKPRIVAFTRLEFKNGQLHARAKISNGAKASAYFVVDDTALCLRVTDMVRNPLRFMKLEARGPAFPSVPAPLSFWKGKFK